MKRNNQKSSHPHRRPTILKLFQRTFHCRHSGGALLICAIFTSFTLSNLFLGTIAKRMLSNLETQISTTTKTADDHVRKLFDLALPPGTKSSFEWYGGDDFVVAVNGALAETWSMPKDGLAAFSTS
mmetsp:Transcript_43904/g.74952  ORF Transcript_43904/g.74952 Transcript_43904/m.74952 type:complete len:126 (-) Transcript_43904:500-877(-)|eukprot:CAMPEP_0183703636 /NCGR_PEP_ID=MMETSP0737-20130205/1317_1 /TAXON_ID=385413 /ORGANISM="Thalassiosira miniscula, Strain CCMP1093" /LENGTH=125 /DNA_ID=CAMNT_0025930433 /DNA_START=682 /DNA_END=1059 /DNA_ORIENTATION=-